MADEEGNPDGAARLRLQRRRGVEADEVGLLQVGHRHPRHEGVVAVLLRRAVVVDEAVVLEFDVGQFRVDIALNLFMPPKLGGEVTKSPGDIPVATPG